MSVSKEQIYKTKCAKPEIFTWYSKRGVTSVFVYSRSVLKDGALGVYDENKNVRSVCKKGVTFVPACFFEKYLGLGLSEDGESVTLSRRKRTLTARVGMSGYTLSGGTRKFPFPVFELNGHKYLPALGTAKALGIDGRSYDDGKLTVFADGEILDEIGRDIELQVSACYATLGKYDASKFTREDFNTVKDKWRTVLVGSEEMNDLSDPDLCEKLAEMSLKTSSSWEALHKEEGRCILWGDAPPSVSADLTRQYTNIWILTQGYATYGTDYYGNEELKDVILDCLEWMYENMYGEAEIEERGWRSMKEFNWWDWFWGGIEPLTNTLLTMEKHLTAAKIGKYLKAFKHVLTLHRLGYKRDCAMSRLTVCTKTALLLEDRAMLEEECADYDLTLTVTRTEGGIHVDYAEWTHNFPYNMMYGFNNLSRTGFVGTLLGGTPMEFVSPKQYELYNVAKYMFEAACYRGQGFMGYNGRATSGTEFTSGVYIMNGILPLIGLFGDDEDMHLKKLIKRCASTPRLIKMLKTVCSVYNFAKLMEILRDGTIPEENDYELCHAWYTADRITQHRNGYAFFIAMTSERHPSYESINSANKRGWYTCDGALYYYNDTDRNAYDGVNFIMNPDVCQRIPGTTVDDRIRQPWSYTCLKGWRSPRDFSGTMDVDKKYGVAAFDYESYNYAGHECDGMTDKDGGGGLTFWENDLEAKKAYFLFDKECVCLGAGINSTMNARVLTTVEHRRLIKDTDILGAEDVYVDGELLPKCEYERLEDDPKWLHLEGFAGYVLPSGGKARISRYIYVPELSGKDGYFEKDPDEDKYRAGKPFFEINLIHGKDPKDASYEYIILPNATPDATEAYAEDLEVEVIANTKKLQAVKKESLGLTFIVFYEAGECSGIRASAPCIVALSERDGSLTVSVAEPTRKVGKITVTLDGVYTPEDVSLRVGLGERGGRTTLSVDTDGTACEAIRTKFRAKTR